MHTPPSRGVSQASHTLPVRMVAVLCVLLLLLSTLPLYFISFFNHPYYDDYTFSAAVHTAWVNKGSFSAVLSAAWQSARQVRNEWQGTYTGTLLSNLQPGVFSEGLYFLTTFLLLTAFLLCFGFLFKVIFFDLLGLSGAQTVISLSLSLILLVQLMPDPDEAFYWFNGGIGNTFIYSLLALSLGLCGKLECCKVKIKKGLCFIALALLMVLLGGGSYGGGLLCLCLYFLITLSMFARRSPHRLMYLTLLLLFSICFLYNLSAPGNTVRAGIIGYRVSPVKAVVQALYHGMATFGLFVRLPVLAVTAVLTPFFYRATVYSSFSFRHPWLVLFIGCGLYCTQFVPPLYAIASIGGGRIVNTYWQSFVVMWLLYVFYLTGFIARRLEKEKQAEPENENAIPIEKKNIQRRTLLPRGLWISMFVLLLVGCLGYKLPNDSLYGLPNLAGGSAALSLVRGEAAQYHREMKAREALLSDTSHEDIILDPLTVVPDIFMGDLLTPEALYDARPALMLYYNKTSITINGGEEVYAN